MKRLPRFITTLLAGWLGLGWASPPQVHSQSAPKAIVLGWDGAVPSFIHEMLRQKKLPNLAKLIESGAFADDVLPVSPSLTAPGFASLLTGASPKTTGITGIRVPRTPRGQFTILESAAGFNPALQRAETIFTAAERAGRKVVSLHVPFGGEKSRLGVYLQGYSGTTGRDGVVHGRNSKPQAAASWLNLPASAAPPLELTLTIGASSLFALLIDDPADPQNGYDTLLVAGARDGREVRAILKPGAAGPGGELLWSRPITLNTGAAQGATTYLRLFDLKSDGSDFFLYYTRPVRQAISHPELLEGTNPTVRAFVGNGGNVLYGQGAFGRTIPNGGDGTAEARYLETVALVQHQLTEACRWALEQLPWDIFFAYTPYPDEAEHQWRGYLDPGLPGFRAELAARLRPLLERVYQSSDGLLGFLMERRPENTVFALISDHGVEGTNKVVYLNKALQQAGLLVLDAQGRVDLAKSKIIYPAIDNGYLLINSTSRKNGIVTVEERPELVRRVRELLLAIRDDGRQVVTGVDDAQSDEAVPGIGGESGGDLYLDLLPGYRIDAKLNASEIVGSQQPHGVHGFNPIRASMRTIMVLNGPGIKAGQRLRDARLVDFVPTLAKLLSIPAPIDAIGSVLQDALAEPH
ncbi:MAG: alkaline phosphatase family protein [Deltaproteobacteria bacterium]|nr:alkaline phosphatase family protein [Deltaproteobacteria bacterium]MDZ4347325.1 alkaline phosphatase family protein [Candidatus Binatia bacterium]